MKHHHHDHEEHEHHCSCGHDHSHEEHHHHDHEEHEHHCGCGHDHSHEEHHHHDHEEHEYHCSCGHDHSHEEHHHHDHEAHEHHHHTVASHGQTIYILENLGCAHCAAKMEEKINALPGVDSAAIVYATKQLRLSAKHPEQLLPEIQRICASIESQVKVTEPPKKSAGTASKDHVHDHDHIHSDHADNHKEEQMDLLQIIAVAMHTFCHCDRLNGWISQSGKNSRHDHEDLCCL